MKPNKRVGTRIHLYNGHTYTTPVPFDVFSTFLSDAEKSHAEWVHVQHEGYDFKLLIAEIFLFEGGVIHGLEEEGDYDESEEG